MILFKNKHVTVFQSALFQTNSTVVETEDCIIVVDPTWLPNEINEIRKYVDEIRKERPIYLYFTHGDFDHVIGYHAFPDATTIGSINLHNHPEKEIKVGKIKQFYLDHYIQHNEPIRFPEIDLIISEDGQTIKIGNTTFTFYLSPGHTKDGLFLYIDQLDIWITGDYLSDFELPIVFDSVKSYYETLEKASELITNNQFSLLIPGHGKVTDSKIDAINRISFAKDYLTRLQQAVQIEDEEAISLLEKEFLFPSAFTKFCHECNVQNMRREYCLS
jgi:hydroxyacylglutathione hydrolase